MNIRKYIFNVLGLKNYLKVLHKGFHFIYSIGILKNNNIYKYHYLDKSIIQKGDYILDIGANLGYYTKLFANWTGNTGKVFAVEPVPAFAEIIKWGTKKYSNIILYNVALGEQEKEVTLTTPGNFGYLKTGLAHINTKNETSNNSEFSFKATMKKGSELFKTLPRLDFIKCDIEGYEDIVIPEIKDVILKYKPIIQIETWGDQKPKIESFLTNCGYEIYDIEDSVLKLRKEMRKEDYGDLLFIHKDNNSVLDRLRTLHLAN